jgi:hypothetical protein
MFANVLSSAGVMVDKDELEGVLTPSAEERSQPTS